MFTVSKLSPLKKCFYQDWEASHFFHTSSSSSFTLTFIEKLGSFKFLSFIVLSHTLFATLLLRPLFPLVGFLFHASHRSSSIYLKVCLGSTMNVWQFFFFWCEYIAMWSCLQYYSRIIYWRKRDICYGPLMHCVFVF